MLIRKTIFPICLVIAILFTGCTAENNECELPYDEIILSTYNVNILHSFTQKEFIEELKNYTPPYETIKYDYYFLYTPQTILDVNKEGKIHYFQHRIKDSLKYGYYESALKTSTIKYFNKLLHNINPGAIDSIYNIYKNKPGCEYDVPFNFTRFYLSLRKGNNLVFAHIYSLDETPPELKRIVEYLQYLSKQIDFEPSSDSTAIVKTSRNIFNSELRIDSINYVHRKHIKFSEPK
ncbi:MAG: hypothetical protein V1720_08005 [bacterium]